jgi:threonylcarbamoyladenosine tRNA methylthiotransferase MtaB
MPQVARAVVKTRARRLREKGEATLLRHLEAEVGNRRRVLAEMNGIGRTIHFTPVRLPEKTRAGAMIDLTVTGHDGRALRAHDPEKWKPVFG